MKTLLKRHKLNGVMTKAKLISIPIALIALLCVAPPSARAISQEDYEHLQNKIEQVRENDPELAQEMEAELAEALENGELSFDEYEDILDEPDDPDFRDKDELDEEDDEDHTTT